MAISGNGCEVFMLNRTKYSFRGRVLQNSSKITLVMMAAPCLILLLAFYYVPLYGWIYAFFDYKVGYNLWNLPFIGLKYFKQALSDTSSLRVLRNTFIMSFFSLALSPVAPMFAICLSELRSSRFQKTIQTMTTLPHFMSWIITYSVFFFLFSADNGIVNKVLLGLGLIKNATNILADGNIVWVFQAMVGLWKGLGFGAVIYFASLAGIDPELYDAANVDGAGRAQRIIHITIPGLVPTYLTLLLINIGFILSNGFDQYYVFSNAAIMDKIEVLDLYIYNVGFYLNNYPLSTSLGVLKIIFSMSFLLFFNMISKILRGQSIV
jgi:putative aldouronate transport system permease protein